MGVLVRASGLAAVLAVGVACGGDDGEAPDDDFGIRLEQAETVELGDDAQPVALAPLADGGLLVGERLTGVVRRIDAAGRMSEPVHEIAVRSSVDDQRGLLGLAVDGDRIYGAWTRSGDGRIVVAELMNGDQRVVWEGPSSSQRSNGGHLAVLPDHRLVVGIGDLLEPDRVADPSVPNGKLLALDPDGPPGQRPEVLSGGWNNPFAFTVTRDGEIWVADNAPGDDPERLGRGDRTDRHFTDLPGQQRAPAALVELAPGLLGVCGYLDGRLTVIQVEGDETQVGGSVATDCRTGAAVLANGNVVVSDGQAIHILELTRLSRLL